MKVMFIKKGTMDIIQEISFGVDVIPQKGDEVFLDYNTYYVTKVIWVLTDDKSVIMELERSLHSSPAHDVRG